MDFTVDINVYRVDDLLSADGVFLCNSIIGIWPVRQFMQSNWEPHSVVGELML